MSLCYRGRDPGVPVLQREGPGCPCVTEGGTQVSLCYRGRDPGVPVLQREGPGCPCVTEGGTQVSLLNIANSLHC